MNPFNFLQSYLDVLKSYGIENLHIFPPVKWDPIKQIWTPRPNCQLSYTAAYSNLERLLLKFGVDFKQFGMHSLCSGGTTDCFQSNVNPRFIDRLGRWKSEASKYRYTRDDMSKFVNELKKVK